MNSKLKKVMNIAKNKTWVSFLYDNQPFTLLHWSIGGTSVENKDVWLLQDEITFETQEFATIDDAIIWMNENMSAIEEIL